MELVFIWANTRFWDWGGGTKKNLRKFFHITLTYKRDIIFFIIYFCDSLSYQSILSLFIYTYLYLTIFKILIFAYLSGLVAVAFSYLDW